MRGLSPISNHTGLCKRRRQVVGLRVRESFPSGEALLNEDRAVVMIALREMAIHGPVRDNVSILFEDSTIFVCCGVGMETQRWGTRPFLSGGRRCKESGWV